MTCTVDMATKQPCTQGLRRQHLTLPGWAQICRKDQSSRETAKVKDGISSPFPRCLEKYTAQHPGVCRENSRTISYKTSSNFQAVLGGMRRALEQHTRLHISKPLTKGFSISD